jgi:cytidyltransferase-like protein
MMHTVGVAGSFDDLRSRHVRFLEEASKIGAVHVHMWSDETVRSLTGAGPKFPQAERLYFLNAIRYVSQVTLALAESSNVDYWAVTEETHSPEKASWCQQAGIEYRVIPNGALTGFPLVAQEDRTVSAQRVEGDRLVSEQRPKVIVTGCYDWLHSGHVRFFEEVSQLGDLYVAVGSDANVQLLKGAGHPLFPQAERRYMVQSIRYVHQALTTSGMGWMDAEPEIEWLKPEMYAVNEDGDKPEKREFCAQHGLRYVVLKRAPKEGLLRRESTKLRGF